MVKRANDSGMVVLIAGLVDPVDTATGSGSLLYPTSSDASTFARNLAARMAGSFVIFSPGFDDKITSSLAGGGTVQSSMNAVGSALATAVPRHLVTNHLAGSSQVANYTAFASQSWLKFYLFQSGHADNPTNACPSGPSTTIPCAMYRARTMPYSLYGSTPSKPVVNGEGPYQVVTGSDTNPVDTRFGVRHAGYLSTLSGAIGYTVGVTDAITVWGDPTSSTGLGARAAQDANILTTHYNNNSRPFLIPQPGWILNNPTADVHKMALGVNVNNNFGIAYMPNDATLEISTASTAWSGLTCGATITWFSPRAVNETTQGTCTYDSVNQKVVLTRPNCTDLKADATGNCDWGIEIKIP